MATKKQNTKTPNPAEDGTGLERDKGYSGSSDWENQRTDQATDAQLREDRERQRQSDVETGE